MASTDATIYALLCGEDTYRVEVALHGGLAMTHPAWNKRYTVVCTAVPGIDFADRRLRAVCHVIVLCPGCVAPSEGVVSYANKPVIAIDEAADSSCARELVGVSAECFYGSCSVSQLRGRLLSLALTPSHVLYDPLLDCLTPTAEAAFRRAFWLLDKTGTALLHQSELLAWRRLVDPTTATESAVRHLVAAFAHDLTNNDNSTGKNNYKDDQNSISDVTKAHGVSTDDACNKNKSTTGERDGAGHDSFVPVAAKTAAASALTPSLLSSSASPAEMDNGETQLTMSYEAFTALHLDWLRAQRSAEAWATLYVMGTQPDGLPYSWYDLHSLRVEPDMNTYLAGPAVQFFRGVYKLHYVRDAAQLWAITPGCPWRYIAGLGGDGDEVDGGDGSNSIALTLDKFIECWKYLALENRTVVVQYARYWGYKGDTGLLFLRRHSRGARAKDEPPPDTLHVLVIGGDGVGKRTLVRFLSGAMKELRPHAVTAGRDVCNDNISTNKANCGDGNTAVSCISAGLTGNGATVEYQSVCDQQDGLGVTQSSSPKAAATTVGGVYVRTATFFVRRGDAEEPQTLLYTVIPATSARAILANKSLLRSIDIALLCIDASVEGLRRSAATALELCQVVFSGDAATNVGDAALSTSASSPNATKQGSVLPCLVVLTKTDLVADVEESDIDSQACRDRRTSVAMLDVRLAREARPLAEFCKQHRLLWPPIRTNVAGLPSPGRSETAMLNTYVYEVVRNPELAIAAPALTPIRILRRLTLLAIVVVTAVAATQNMTQRLRRRRLRSNCIS